MTTTSAVQTPPVLTVLYRGALETCNYSCSYCPFAKAGETPSQRRSDEGGLDQFVAWIERHPDRRFALCFTPWGEALVFKRYRDALQRLSRLTQVESVMVQTNLHASLDWLEQADCHKLSLWCTYHPSETTQTRFLKQVAKLSALGVRHSVGMVAKPRNLAQAESLRAMLPPSTYLWLNAYCHGRKKYPYTAMQLERLRAVDPHVDFNLHPHASKGEACRTGETSITVDEHGAIRRCHFIGQVIGNVQDPAWPQALKPRPCSRAACDCHVGYVHLERLHMDRVFGQRPVERVPLM